MDTAQLRRHFDEFRTVGWTVLPGFLAPTTVATLCVSTQTASPSPHPPEAEGAVVGRRRRVLDADFGQREWAEPPQRLKVGGAGRGSGDAGLLDAGAVARHPELARLCTHELLLRPELLDLAELIMGEVSLDSLQMSGLAAATPAAEHRGRVGTAGWHRDSGGTHGHGVWWRWQTDDARPYTTPLGCNCLVYLQDMTDDSGQLRVVPFSHLGGIPTPEPEAKMAPLPGETLLDAKAGDLVVIHCDTLHSTTANVDPDQIRYFISAYVTRYGLPHRDEFDAPAVHKLLADARQPPVSFEDRRVLRLFGEDAEGVVEEELEARLRRLEQARAGRL